MRAEPRGDRCGRPCRGRPPGLTHEPHLDGRAIGSRQPRQVTGSSNAARCWSRAFRLDASDELFSSWVSMALPPPENLADYTADRHARSVGSRPLSGSRPETASGSTAWSPSLPSARPVWCTASGRCSGQRSRGSCRHASTPRARLLVEQPRPRRRGRPGPTSAGVVERFTESVAFRAPVAFRAVRLTDRPGRHSTGANKVLHRAVAPAIGGSAGSCSSGRCPTWRPKPSESAGASCVAG
jgi:hypothetical protein